MNVSHTGASAGAAGCCGGAVVCGQLRCSRACWISRIASAAMRSSSSNGVLGVGIPAISSVSLFAVVQDPRCSARESGALRSFALAAPLGVGIFLGVLLLAGLHRMVVDVRLRCTDIGQIAEDSLEADLLDLHRVGDVRAIVLVMPNLVGVAMPVPSSLWPVLVDSSPAPNAGMGRGRHLRARRPGLCGGHCRPGTPQELACELRHGRRGAARRRTTRRISMCVRSQTCVAAKGARRPWKSRPGSPSDGAARGPEGCAGRLGQQSVPFCRLRRGAFRSRGLAWARPPSASRTATKTTTAQTMTP